MKQILVFDIETGGVNPFVNGIATITLKVYKSPIMKTIIVKPNERLKYEDKAFEINGLSKEYLLEHGVNEQEAVKQVMGFIKDNYSIKPNLLGHNVSFDIRFMDALFQRNLGHSFMNYCYYHPKDTMIYMDLLRDAKLIELRSISLTNSYKYMFGKELVGAHNSESDVIATEELYDKILQLLKQNSMPLDI